MVRRLFVVRPSQRAEPLKDSAGTISALALSDETHWANDSKMCGKSDESVVISATLSASATSSPARMRATTGAQTICCSTHSAGGSMSRSRCGV